MSHQSCKGMVDTTSRGNIMRLRYGDTIERQWKTCKGNIVRLKCHNTSDQHGEWKIRWSTNHKHNSGRVSINGLESPDTKISPMDQGRWGQVTASNQARVRGLAPAGRTSGV